MPHPLFSDQWAADWRDALNNSHSYRAAASSWQWPLVVVADDVAAWYLDLHEGVCRAIRRATNDDLTQADFVLTAPLATWQRILDGEAAPMVAIMNGSLRLERGSMITLARYTGAASEMLAAAMSLSKQPAAAKGAPNNGAETVTRSAPSSARHDNFRSTSAGGLDHESFPMQLFQKAKKLGVWDPADIDFSTDRVDWTKLEPVEQDVLLRLISMFQAGEEAVTLDLLPLIKVIASEGRIEEEMYLTTFLFEEAKHTEFFRRFLDEVACVSGALDEYHTPAYRRLFYEELPAALSALDNDDSPRAQMAASTTYNMIVEGTLAETGYHALYNVLDRRSILPGLRKGTGLLQRDESRHIAFGIYLISRLVQNEPDLMAEFQQRMNDLLPVAIEVITELFAVYDPMPFGLREEDFLGFAADQFGKRMRRIESTVRPTSTSI